VLAGYRSGDDSVAIADPLLDNPAHGTKYYRANVYRLLGAIFLGVGTDDGTCRAPAKGLEEAERGQDNRDRRRRPATSCC
jgi:hypothetical protein